jgi:hypothetical protein
MADPTPADPTSPRRTLGAPSIPAGRIVRAYQNPGQVGLADPVARGAGDGRGTSPSITAPKHMLLDDWQDLSLAILQIPEPKPASGAMTIANNFKTRPEVHLRCRWCPPVRKEGL